MLDGLSGPDRGPAPQERNYEKTCRKNTTHGRPFAEEWCTRDRHRTGGRTGGCGRLYGADPTGLPETVDRSASLSANPHGGTLDGQRYADIVSNDTRVTQTSEGTPDMATGPKKPDLGEIDGISVAGATIAIRSAGDGLSKAMKVDPQLIHHKQTVYVVLECECIDVQFPQIPDANEVTRKHILKAGVATLIDRKAVIAALDATRDQIQAARDAETGAATLDFGSDPLNPGGDGEPYVPVTGPSKKPAGTTTGASKPTGRTAAKAAKKAPAKKATAKKMPAKKAAGHLASVPTGPDA